jgi:hypothetical protein
MLGMDLRDRLGNRRLKRHTARLVGHDVVRAPVDLDEVTDVLAVRLGPVLGFVPPGAK